MADKLISDAVSTPQDEGIGSALVDGEDETFRSAGAVGATGQAIRSSSYVASGSELVFSGHDATNDTVDVTAGIAYLDLSGVVVDIQSETGSDNLPPAYDTTLPSGGMMMVVVPSTVSGVALQDSTLSDVWLAYDTDGTGPGAAGSVYLRSDDTGSVSAPSHPSVKLGEANPDDATADVLSNRGASPSFDQPSLGDATADSLNASNALKAPVYADNANALQEDESLWYNDGTGPDASGYYGFDGGSIVGPFGSGGVQNPLTQTLDAGGNDITGVGSLDTDGASIANPPTGDDDALRWQEGTESGLITSGGLDNSTGNDDWGQAVNSNVAETFDNAFEATPDITTSQDSDNDTVFGGDYRVAHNNKSTTGFDAQFFQVSADDRTGETYALTYTATEGR